MVIIAGFGRGSEAPFPSGIFRLALEANWRQRSAGQARHCATQEFFRRVTREEICGHAEGVGLRSFSGGRLLHQVRIPTNRSTWANRLAVFCGDLGALAGRLPGLIESGEIFVVYENERIRRQQFLVRCFLPRDLRRRNGLLIIARVGAVWRLDRG